MLADLDLLLIAVYCAGAFCPVLPARDAFHERRLRLSGRIEALIAGFARQ